jgi:beta-glucosidase
MLIKSVLLIARKAYVDYAEACFAAFGDRVKHWITFNEPVQFSYNGYGTGIHAPGRCSNREMCPEGNSAVEPYLAAHHVLLAHAATMDLFRKFFKVILCFIINQRT